MLDNASNNDTMIEGIQKRAASEGIKINAAWARLRCMPHTIHLAAIKVNQVHCMDSRLNCPQLLEAIGAVSKSDSSKATSRNGNYQDSATTPLSRAYDDEAAGQDDGYQLCDVTLAPDASGHILVAVDKVSHSFSCLCMHK
jgi:hypothetical protein